MRDARRAYITGMECVGPPGLDSAAFVIGVRPAASMTARRVAFAGAIACSLLFLVPVAGRAEPRTLHLDAMKSRVLYRIDFSVAAVTGVAGTPAGEIVVAGDTVAPHAQGRVTVDLRQLQTGISQRDRHIKSDEYLDLERYPVAEFALDSLSARPPPQALPPERGELLGGGAGGPPPAWSGTAWGRVTLHGKSHDQQVPVGLWWLEHGKGLRVRGDFIIELADHDIKRPKKFFLKAGKNVRVHLDLVFEP